MATTYEEITTLIPNTTMKKRYVDGIFKTYNITPNYGYVLHDKARDYTDLEYIVDEETGETIENEVFKRGYTTGTASCGYNYDFATAQIELECGIVTAYGTREFCAVLETSIPENQIFGGMTPPTEVM